MCVEIRLRGKIPVGFSLSKGGGRVEEESSTKIAVEKEEEREENMQERCEKERKSEGVGKKVR